MSKKEKKEKEPLLKFKDFPTELKNFFYKKLALVTGCAVALIIISIILKNPKATIILTGVILLYVGYVLFQLIECMGRKIYVYKGKFEKKNYDIYGLKKKDGTPTSLSTSSPCNIILSSNEDTDIKYIVPVGASFKVDTGNEVTIYCKENNIYVKNDNSYYFNSPLLVSVSKY